MEELTDERDHRVRGGPDTAPVPELLSVNVSLPAVLARTRDGDPVLSAIAKQSVDAVSLRLSTTNLEGDQQADLTVHGGPDKAVYAYSADHFTAWSDELGQPAGISTFGENLTVAGLTENNVAIGDRWSWGDAELEICQPRWPCFKLTLHTHVREIGARMRESGRTGWYLRVITPGTVPTCGPIKVVHQDPAGVTVTDAHLAALDRHHEHQDQIDRVLAVGALSTEWRAQLGV